jgi:hypothetical protein
VSLLSISPLKHLSVTQRAARIVMAGILHA